MTELKLMLKWVENEKLRSIFKEKVLSSSKSQSDPYIFTMDVCGQKI